MNILDTIKLPPFDLDAERSILGILLIQNEKYFKICDLIKEEYFYERNHRTVFKIIEELVTKNEPADLMIIKDELLKKGKLEEIGGIPFITKLLDDISSPANIEYYCQIIYDKYLLRQLIQIGNMLLTKGYEAKEDAILIIEDVENTFIELIKQQDSSDIHHISEGHENLLQELTNKAEDPEKYGGIYTGLIGLDDIIGGILKGEIVIIGGRPNMGKTFMLLQIARHACENNRRKALFFSLEMSRKQLMERVLAYLSLVAGKHFRKGTVLYEHHRRIKESFESLKGTNIRVIDKPQTVENIAMLIKKYHIIYGFDIVLIDHMQKITTKKKCQNMNEQVTHISKTLQSVARELEIPIVIASQLSRASEKRATGGRKSSIPKLSDLRDSGSIEQDADIVFFLYNKEEYEKDEDVDFDPTKFNEILQVELLVEKHRSGITNKCMVRFLREYGKFEDDV